MSAVPSSPSFGDVVEVFDETMGWQKAVFLRVLPASEDAWSVAVDGEPGITSFLVSKCRTIPTEVASPRDELRHLTERQAAQRIHHLETSLKFLADIARGLGFKNRRQESNQELVGRALCEQAEAMERLMIGRRLM